jgi:hypothetical protein
VAEGRGDALHERQRPPIPPWIAEQQVALGVVHVAPERVPVEPVGGHVRFLEASGIPDEVEELAIDAPDRFALYSCLEHGFALLDHPFDGLRVGTRFARRLDAVAAAPVPFHQQLLGHRQQGRQDGRG